MKKAWKVVLIIVAVVIVLGIVGVVVGRITGADTQRILQSMDDEYQIYYLRDYFTEVVNEIISARTRQ